MLTDQRITELEKLAQRVIVAHDRYYYDMEKADFEDEFDYVPDDDAIYQACYLAYNEQREIGFDNFAQKVTQEFATIVDSEELHYLVEHYNYDDGEGLLTHIINNPACSLATAQQIFWLNQPSFAFKNYGSLQAVLSDELIYDSVQLLLRIIKKAQNNEFLVNDKIKISQEIKQSIMEEIQLTPLATIPKILYDNFI